jgi:hypothetical protein
MATTASKPAAASMKTYRALVESDGEQTALDFKAENLERARIAAKALAEGRGVKLIHVSVKSSRQAKPDPKPNRSTGRKTSGKVAKPEAAEAAEPKAKPAKPTAPKRELIDPLAIEGHGEALTVNDTTFVMVPFDRKLHAEDSVAGKTGNDQYNHKVPAVVSIVVNGIAKFAMDEPHARNFSRKYDVPLTPALITSTSKSADEPEA